MNAIELDFEQAKAKHLLFKSRLRSILYDITVDDGPVLSHHECSVGKWIYGHALATYGHLPQMQELERVHADIHTSARRLVRLYRDGYPEEAREGLAEMEQVADRLVGLLDSLEHQLQEETPAPEPTTETYISLSLRDFQEMLSTDQELDLRIKEQIAETARATEHLRHSTRALQESETLFRTITNASPVGLFLTDEEGKVVYANQTILDWLDLSMEAYLATGGAEKIVAEDLPGLTSDYLAAFAARQPYQGELRIHHADGTLHWCQIAAVPRTRTDGAFAGYVGSFSDITERKAAEEHQRQYYDDLEVKVTFRNLELERQVRDLQAQLIAAKGAG